MPSKMGYSQSLFGASLNLSAAPMSSASIPRRTTSATRVRSEAPSSQEEGPQQKDTVEEVQETPVNLSVRAGLSRATATAPLLKTPLQPLKRAPEPPGQNKAVRIRAGQMKVAVEAQTENIGTNSSFEEDVSLASMNQSTSKPDGRDRARGQKAAPKSKQSPPPIVVLDDEEDDGAIINNGENHTSIHNNGYDGENHDAALDLPPERSKKPTSKAASAKAAPARRQPKTSKSTKSSRTTKAQNAGPEDAFEEERETTVGLYMPPEGPRAQLRIQPRQKRGLLVSSEKGNKAKKSKVHHEDNHAELEYQTDHREAIVRHKYSEPPASKSRPTATSEDNDPFASFAEPSTVHKLTSLRRQREAIGPVVRNESDSLRTTPEILVSSQTVIENRPPNVGANEGPPVNSGNAVSVPASAALGKNKTGANGKGSAGPQGTTRVCKRPPAPQKTAGLVEDTTQDQRNTVQSSGSPQAPPSRSTRQDNSPGHLQADTTDDEDIDERPRARQTRKRVTLALDESNDEKIPTRRTRKRMTMASDGSDDEGSATRQSTSQKPSVSGESDVEERPTRQSKRHTRKTFDESDEGRYTRQTRGRPTAAVEESDSDELPQVPVGPRLAKLRKSVKSREVIGFVPSSSPVMEAVIIAEPRPPIITAPSPAPVPTPNLMETHPVVDRTDVDSLANITDRTITEPGTNVPERELVTAGVVHNSPASKASPPLAPLKSTTDIASDVQRDNSYPTIASRGAPVNKSAQDHTPVHVEQSIRDPPSGKSPHHHVASASGVDKAGQSAVAHQQTMSLLDTNLTSLSAAPLSDKGPGLITEEVEGALRSHKPVSHPEVHEHLIAVPRDVGVSSVTSDNPSGQGPNVPPAVNARPKITNPATRGRKAALKSHAAGQVPQSILPLEPTPVRLTMRPPETTRPEAAAGGRPKYKMQLPGFTSAKETARDSAGDVGPWSREAHDLFGSGRPSA
ncbi:hypothetical protein B0T21DRAFT_372156 [Apiosordaria backusii]|uniref:Uncharacterized protein n=1 Tax=Apiosordaria backusii TaxID=314023 RepID=A0AA40E3H3_9PEZI|nr:hypothetical protein B0T21DRAFT_372156 [Apiosordaria backusii]